MTPENATDLKQRVETTKDAASAMVAEAIEFAEDGGDYTDAEISAAIKHFLPDSRDEMILSERLFGQAVDAVRTFLS